MTPQTFPRAFSWLMINSQKLGKHPLCAKTVFSNNLDTPKLVLCSFVNPGRHLIIICGFKKINWPSPQPQGFLTFFLLGLSLQFNWGVCYPRCWL